MSLTHAQLPDFEETMTLSDAQLEFLQAETQLAPILISDDDSMTRALYRAIFERAGNLACIEIWSATEVLRICQEQPVSLVISDIRNQHMNGLDMLRALRENPYTHHIPVLFVTATQDTRDQAYDAGANGYMYKPFQPSDLLLEIWHLIAIQ
jgi:CheY-like chemotaxis protein